MTPPHRLRRTPWLATAFLATGIVALAASTPVLGEGAREVVMALFDPLCHQRPDRSFSTGGVHFALCHRCFGVAAGLALGALLAPLLAQFVRSADGRALPALALAALPILADWALDAAGVWANTPLTRAATGVAFGVVAGAVLVGAVATATGNAPRSTAQPETL